MGDAGAADTGAEIPFQPFDHVRVATWNVWRFFDTVCDSGSCGRDDYEPRLSRAQFNARADQVANGIRALDADVVLLQEVENAAVLEAIRARLGRDYVAAVVGETGAHASLDVAALSRLPVLEVRRHRSRDLTRPDGSETHFSRELLELRLDAGHDLTLIAFVAHFRSKIDDDPGRRFAEGETTGTIVAATARAVPGALVLLGGDLNDTPGSPPLNALEAAGDLQRVAAELGRAEATYRYDGRTIAIDHLYLVEGGPGSYVPSSAHVTRDPGWGYAGSDHAALSAEFELKRSNSVGGTRPAR